MTVFLFTDRCLQGNRFLRDLDDLTYTLYRDLHALGNFFRRRFPAQLLQQLSADTDQLVDGLDHVYRNTDGTGLIRDGPGDGLTDPPCGVGGELEALVIVKFLNGLDQSQIAFLDQVKEQHAAAHIALGNADDQTEVGFRQTLFGFFIAFFHPLGQLDLFFRCQKGHLADLLQIHSDRIFDIDAVRDCQVNILGIYRVLAAFLNTFEFFTGGVILILLGTDKINTVLFQMLDDGLKCFLAQFHILKFGNDIAVIKDFLVVLSLFDQFVHSFQDFFPVIIQLFGHPFISSIYLYLYKMVRCLLLFRSRSASHGTRACCRCRRPSGRFQMQL